MSRRRSRPVSSWQVPEDPDSSDRECSDAVRAVLVVRRLFEKGSGPLASLPVRSLAQKASAARGRKRSRVLARILRRFPEFDAAG